MFIGLFRLFESELLPSSPVYIVIVLYGGEIGRLSMRSLWILQWKVMVRIVITSCFVRYALNLVECKGLVIIPSLKTSNYVDILKEVCSELSSSMYNINVKYYYSYYCYGIFGVM